MTKKATKIPKVAEATVVSTTTFNTMIDAKVSRKELVDMIMEEQEAQLEDAIEKVGEKVQKANKEQNEAHKKALDFICAALKNTGNLANLKKVFTNHTFELYENVSISYNMQRYGEEDSRELYLSASVFANITMNKTKEVTHPRRETVTLVLLSKSEILKLKGVKAVVDKYIESCNNSAKASDELVKVNNTKRTFDKKGKRARASFIREIMKGSEEGKQILAQLDEIKANTQKLLE